jgi:PPOX class probable F420-dependent enzyme
MPPLSDEEREDFLTATDQEPWGRCTAEIATLTPDGKPYVNPVWYEWEDDRVYILGKPKAQYVKNIRENPEVFVVIDKQSPPYVRVNIQGTATIIDEEWNDRWEAMARTMTDAYLGEQGLEYHEERLQFPVSVIEVTPEAMNTWKVTDFPPDRTFSKTAVWHSQDE